MSEVIFGWGAPDYIERLIDEAGREEVFRRARELGWSDGGAPLFVWNGIAQDIIHDRAHKVRKEARG